MERSNNKRVFNTLPQEIKNLIQERSGYSILIKGSPGVGKTLLTLEMLSHAKKSIYIASRVTPHVLIEHAAMLKEEMQKIKIIDASRTLLPKSEVNINNKKLFFNTIKYHDMPGFIGQLMSEIETMSKESSDILLVGIDSWEAVLETKKQDFLKLDVGQKRIEALFSDIVKFSNVNLILVSECDEKSFLDYLVDVVIYLELDYIDGQPIRTLEIRKLRGAKISQPRYTYSLEGGRFRYFEKFRFKLPEIMVRHEIIPDPKPYYISTGLKKFDEILDGGIKYGSWILFEVGKSIGEGFFQIIIPIIANQLNQDRDVLMILPEGTNIYQFEQLHSGFINPDKFQEHVTVYEMIKPKDLKDSVKSVVCSINPDPLAMFSNLEGKLKEKGKDLEKPPLLVLGLDTLELLYSEKEFLKAIVSNISFTKNFLNVTLALAKEEQQCLKILSHLCTRHIKFELINQTLVIKGIQPLTCFYAVDVNLSQGFINLDFIPIV
ncbi:MAG: gas vesicle protein GvpD P-loop domain-containing protein [Promethearchaeota archaeon]